MKISSGILMYNNKKGKYLLVRPGGPFYKNKNIGIWTIPKGIINKGEDEISAAKREFKEETGHEINGALTYLGEIRLRKSKKIIVFSTEGFIEADKIVSNTFKMEYPKNSGEYHSFPEIEKGDWFSFEEAKKIINPKLLFFLEKLEAKK